ncbi:MAG: ABC transporter substrate-binding protein [Candidatus Pacearchaeota archaeon]
MEKQKRNNLIAGVAVVAIIVLVIALSGNNAQAETIKIGAVYPLSGPLSSYGTEYKRGLEMAAEEINSNGGINGKKVELIFEDDQGRPKKSTTAVKKLINVNNVDYLFTAFSSTSKATAPIAQENKVLYISATVSRIGDQGKYIFRDFWDINTQGAAIGNAMEKEGMEKVGIIAMRYGDTEAFLDDVKREAENVTFVDQRFDRGTKDFRTQLTKIKDANVDGILVYAFPGSTAIQITEQIKELGLDDKRLFAGATTYAVPFMYNQFSETLEKMGAIDTGYSLEESNEKAMNFTEKYEKRYNTSLIGDAAYPYDDLYALKEAIEDAGNSENTTKVANELKDVEMMGAAGKLEFDENGNSQRPAYLQQYTKDGWERYNL